MNYTHQLSITLLCLILSGYGCQEDSIKRGNGGSDMPPENPSSGGMSEQGGDDEPGGQVVPPSREFSTFTANWPDGIICRASEDRYEILFNRVRGGSQNVAFTNQTSYLRFNGETRTVDTAEGTSVTFQESDCIQGALIDDMEQFTLQKSRDPSSFTAVIAGWPEVIMCEGDQNTYEIAYQRLRGNQGNVSYTNGHSTGVYVSFDEDKTINNVGGGTMVFAESTCKIDRQLNELKSFYLNTSSNLGDALIESWPDAIVCEADEGRYEILFNRLRGGQGHVTYSNDSALVRFDGENKTILETMGMSMAFTESDCVQGAELPMIRSFNMKHRE